MIFRRRGLRRPRCCGAVGTLGIAVVDLGLSGSDFSELKAHYGFVSVGNCPTAADYALRQPALLLDYA